MTGALIESSGPKLAALLSTRSIAFGISALIVLASVVDNTLIHHLDSDMSWLLVFNDRMIDGQRLYTENGGFLAETFLYFSAAWLAHVTGLKAEMLVGLLAYLWAAGCLVFAGSIAHRVGLFRGQNSIWIVPIALAVVLLSMPQTFAQREFFGVLAALPMLVVAAGRYAAKLSLPVTISSGVLASITMIVKPHYAVAFLLPYAYLAIYLRSARVLVAPEVVSAGVLVIASGVFVLAAYPNFVSELLPVVADVYGWRRRSLAFLMLNSPAILVVPIAAVYGFLLIKVRAGPHIVFALSSLGFFAAFIYMGKGFPYHALPFVVTGVLAVAAAATDFYRHPRGCWTDDDRKLLRIGLVALGFLLIAMSIKTFERIPTDPEVRATVESLIAPNPTVGVIASSISIGHPFTRLVNGRWVGRDCSDWIGAYALERQSWGLDSGEGAARISSYIASALTRKRREILVEQPDILIVNHFDAVWVQLVMSDPVIAGQLTHYVPFARRGTVEYMRRVKE